ncbi:hypothetical protein [Nostoc cycadae]|uniref:hypothetical protein n=1 Tax=Nostoc cycadae TaxID=246795 RepID=UPI000CCC854F|nr:hypothetical protein [Nostoc cycadae]
MACISIFFGSSTTSRIRCSDRNFNPQLVSKEIAIAHTTAQLNQLPEISQANYSMGELLRLFQQKV